MLSLAAREADIVGIMPGPLTAGEPVVNDTDVYSAQHLARKISWLREAAGDRFERLELSIIATPVFTNDRRAGAEQVASRRGWSGVAPEEILEMPTIFIGTVEQVAEQMLALRESFGISYFMTLDHQMEACAPLVERLSKS